MKNGGAQLSGAQLSIAQFLVPSCPLPSCPLPSCPVPSCPLPSVWCPVVRCPVVRCPVVRLPFWPVLLTGRSTLTLSIAPSKWYSCFVLAPTGWLRGLFWLELSCPLKFRLLFLWHFRRHLQFSPVLNEFHLHIANRPFPLIVLPSASSTCRNYFYTAVPLRISPSCIGSNHPTPQDGVPGRNRQTLELQLQLLNKIV